MLCKTSFKADTHYKHRVSLLLEVISWVLIKHENVHVEQLSGCAEMMEMILG